MDMPAQGSSRCVCVDERPSGQFSAAQMLELFRLRGELTDGTCLLRGSPDFQKKMQNLDPEAPLSVPKLQIRHF